MKTIYLSLCIVMSILAVNAQTIIPKAGVTLSTNNQTSATVSFGGSSSSTKVKPAIGFTVGVACQFIIDENVKSTFSFQPELAFIQKGYKYELYVSQSGDYTSQTGIHHINYIELPVLAKWNFGSENARAHINFGPSFAYALGGSYKFKQEQRVNSTTTSGSESGKIKFGDEPQSNQTDAYFDNRLDIGLQLGGGITLNKKIIIDLRYGLGFSGLTDGTSSKNRVTQLTIGMPLGSN